MAEMHLAEVLDLEERIRLAIRIGESHYREFKSSFDGPPGAKVPRPLKSVMTDISEALVAFANADGGELIVGVEDDGTITGVPYEQQAIDALLGSDLSHVHRETPLPSVRKRAISIDDASVIYFSVSKGNVFVHLTADGRCLRRVDRETVPHSPDRITADRVEDQSRTWDRAVAELATVDDLDLDLVGSVAAQIAYGISVEKCLQYLDLAEFTPDGLRLKRAAVLLFAKDVRRWHSGCSVRIITVGGKEKRSGDAFNVKKDDFVHGNILRLADSSWERLMHALSTRTQFTETARFQTTFMFPQIAVRETLMNAIVHRNYAVEGRGIEVSIYQDRIEILSPGMLLSTISIDALRGLTGVHESRNPLVARVMREVGLIREMGEGMRRIYNVMRSSALAEPALESTTAGFNVTLYHKSLYDPNVKLWLTTYDSFRLTEDQVAIMALGYGGKPFSAQDIIDRLGIIDIDQMMRTISPIRRLGLIERTMSAADAYKEAERRRIPKREVKTYRVVAPGAAKPNDAVEGERRREGRLVAHKVFLGNLPYKLAKAELVEWLSQWATVLDLVLPAGVISQGENRGFAFATLEYAGPARGLLSKLDGQLLRGKRIHAAPRIAARRASSS